MKSKKWLSLLMVFALIFSTMGGSFAAYYDELPVTDNVNITGINYQYVYVVDPYTHKLVPKNTIRFSVKWKNVESYSFNNEDWYATGNNSGKTFYIREDYYNKTAVSGVEVVLPKSVNVMFLYIKEHNRDQAELYTYKLSGGDLSFLYGSNPIPQHIINVTDAIDLLPAKANLKIADETKLKNARAAYDALGVDKIWVYNAHKLLELETRLDEIKTGLIDWTQIYKDIDNANAGKLTEQYYEVPNQLYAELYVQADKAKIYQKKIGTGPKYTTANISVDVLKDTTPQADNVFFTYDYNHAATGKIPSAAMAKKVWGFFTPTESGRYQFKITSDDGHNWVMYLDDGERLKNKDFKILDYTTTIASQYDLHNINDFMTGSFNLKAGTPYPLFVEYFNHGGNAAFKIQYKLLKDNGGSTGWTDLKGSVFKPSTAYEFGFQAGNPVELQKLVTEAEALKLTYNTPSKIGTQEGQVSQAALDVLIKKLNAASASLELAKKNTLTQSQIDEAAAILKLAIEEFKNAIVKKPNGVSVPFSAQNGNSLLVEFNKDTVVKTYEIIVSEDNAISADDKLYTLTNGNFVLGSAASINVVEGDLSGTLEKLGTANGRFIFNLPLGSLVDKPSLTVFIRTANGDNKGDATANTIGLLKTPGAFRYALTEESVIFYTVDKAGETGFAIDYYAPGSTVLSRGYVLAEGKDYLVVNKASVDLDKIMQAQLYAIKIKNGVEDYRGGHSAAKTNPTKIDIPAVANLKLAIEDGRYQLTWNMFQGATAYEVFVGDTADISKMIKLSANVAENKLDLGNYQESVPKYYAIRAVVSNDQYTRSGYSNVVQIVKPAAPQLLKFNEMPRELTPPDKTNYVIKGDGTTKGYYLVTMPSALLNLTEAKRISESSTGSYVANFPETADNKSVRFDEIDGINFSRYSTDSAAGLVTFKVPYDKTDVGITLEGVKHKLGVETLTQITVVKYVEDGANVSGISFPASFAIKVLPTRADLEKVVKIVDNPFVKIEGNQIKAMMGADFEITYRYTVNAEAVYSPNFVFDFIDNDYFAYEYPTISAVVSENGTASPLKFHTSVTNNSDGNLTKVTVITDDDSNFSNKEVLITVKVKPIMKKGTDIVTLARNAKLISTGEDWKLAYVIESIKKNGVLVMDGLKLVNYVEFDNAPDSPSAVKDNSIDPATLNLFFKNKATIEPSY